MNHPIRSAIICAALLLPLCTIAQSAEHKQPEVPYTLSVPTGWQTEHRPAKDHTAVFIEIPPKPPGQAVWKKMDEIGATFSIR